MSSALRRTGLALAVMGGGGAISQAEIEARRQLVALAEAMLLGHMSYFEGAPRVCALQDKVGELLPEDPDFDAFVLISSETDHLPLDRSRQYWSASALKRLEPEFQRTEEWAKQFAPRACEALLARYKQHDC